MCYQVVEVYAACRCLYYQHTVDRCASYGRPGHGIQKRTIPVGYACSTHHREQTPRGTIPVADPYYYSYRHYQEQSPRRSRDQNSAVSVPKRPRIKPNKIAEQVEKTVPTPKKDNGSENTECGSDSPITASDPKRTPRLSREKSSKANALRISDFETREKIWEMREKLAENSDSNDSIDSRSTTSQASTATTVGENALEALFRGLLQHPRLYNLWPQIIAGQSSRGGGRQTIDRFLRRFAEDLECLAASSTEDEEPHRTALSSSRFVSRHRAEIALRIYQAHEIRHKSLDADTDTKDSGILATEDAPDTDVDQFLFSVAEEFIFGTEPILHLEENISTFIRQRQQKRFSRVATNLRSFTSVAMQFFSQTAVQAGKTRVGWTCICGCQIIDDYESKYEGAVEAFEHRLKQYNHPMQPVQEDGDTNRNNVVGQHSWKGAISTAMQWFHKCLTIANSPGLPSHQQDNNLPPPQLGSCARSLGTAQSYHNFVLLCVPYLRWGLRLHNTEVCRINSDQQFFKLLRECYFGQRRGVARRALQMFTKVRALQFVKFEVFRNRLVDVRVCPSMPTSSNDYAYDPMPPDTIPPIGTNLLMHLFENPDHADVTLFLYNRFPKKLRAQLEACPIKGSSIGWGIEFVEGVDWYAVFVSGCFGFFFCLLFAVAWAAARGDVQGGFGIASFLLTFFVFCGGTLHYMI
ncbi:hypothetical protein F4803DRAFT_248206 [Xylaria telfairii]|nr:hypothetical protein F4803DRAFT_248206 [Xylaria telfairii]